MKLTRIRTLFVSDVHLGYCHSHPDKFLDSIRRLQAETLVIVGDFIDGRRLSHRWRWTSDFDRIFDHLKQVARGGCRVVYIPGNHDEFLRQPENQVFDFVEIRNEFEYELKFGGSVSVLHGDIYDRTEIEKTLGSRLGCGSYDMIVRLHSWANRMAGRWGMRRVDVCSVFKAWIWQAHRHIASFRQKLCRHARFRNHAGVVCGHIHVPQLKILDGLLYLNTGDWVENASLVMETLDGDIELYNHGVLIERQTCRELRDQTDRRATPRLADPAVAFPRSEDLTLDRLASEFRSRIHEYHLKAG